MYPTAQTELKEGWMAVLSSLLSQGANKGSFLRAQKPHGITVLLYWLTLLGLTHGLKGSLSTCGRDMVAPSLEFPDGDVFCYEVSVASRITSSFLGKCRTFGKWTVADRDTHFPELHVLLESSCL